MKKTTRHALALVAGHYSGCCDVTKMDRAKGQDALDSDARQRAEIRDLKARLAAAAEGALYFGHPIRTRERREALDLAERAIDLKNKNWRKP